MTTQYGIGVTKNRYELFDIDDEDPLEILKFHEQEKEARKKTKQSEKENKGKDVVQKPKAVTVRKGIKETQILKPHETSKGKDEKAVNTTARGYDRSDRKFVGDNREDRNNRRNRGAGANDGGEYQRGGDERSGGVGGAGIDRKDNRGNLNLTSGGTTGTFNEQSNHAVTVGRGGGLQRGSGRLNSGGGRGGQSARGFRGGARGGGGATIKGPANTFENRPGRRDYDRQMVNEKNELNNTMAQATDDSSNWIQEKQDGDGANPDTNCGVTTTDVDEVGGIEEERKELTLDEWKAMKAPRQKPTYNLRKAGEGEDLSQWKKMYALQRKKDGDDDEEEEEYEYESCEYPQRVGRQKHVLDIDIHFKDTRSGGRSRGGRGTGRGGPRMGSRVGQSGVTNNTADRHAVHARDNKSAPKVDDEHDFPSLG